MIHANGVLAPILQFVRKSLCMPCPQTLESGYAQTFALELYAIQKRKPTEMTTVGEDLGKNVLTLKSRIKRRRAEVDILKSRGQVWMC